MDTIYNLRLYESQNVNMLIDWVPNAYFYDKRIIQKFIEQNYAKVMKIADTKHKDGLRSGMRILVMSKNDIETKPIPSYITIDGFELFCNLSGPAPYM